MRKKQKWLTDRSVRRLRLAVRSVARYNFSDGRRRSRRVGVGQGAVTDWARILAYVTGTVDQELLARNEYLAVENRIMKAQLKGRLNLKTAVMQFPSV